MTSYFPSDLFDGAEHGDEHHAASPTARVCEAMALFGPRPGAHEPDSRPLPEPAAIEAAIAALAETLAGVLGETRLEDDLDPLLWGLVNIFHRHAARVERALDANEQAQRRSQAEQDGSEIRSVELERLLEQGQTLIERRDAFETMRDVAAEHYKAATGSAWRPHAGSLTNKRALTAAIVDSRDFIAARKHAEREVLIPKGPRIAFAGGVGCNDIDRINGALDKVFARHSGMVLLHGGADRGAERIAACWAEHHKVPQVVFKPDWKQGRRAPFKRNDALLETLPIGVVAFPGSGITENLVDKARAMGIPVWRFTGGAR